MARANPSTQARIPGVQIIKELYRADLAGNRGITISSFATDRSRVGAAAPSARYRIQRRDLRQQFDVDPERRSYRILPIWSLLSEEEQERFIRSGRHWRKSVQPPEPPVMREVRITHSYTPTGELKSLFGCTATRWTIVRQNQRDPGPLDSVHSDPRNESITDAWYLGSDELQHRYPSFSTKLVHRGMVSVHSGDERVVHETEGKPPRGLCVFSETKTRQYSRRADGELREQTSVTVSSVTDIAEKLFEPSFFDAPAGFRQLPVYPGRLTMLRLEIGRTLGRWRWRIFNHP